MPQRIVAIIGRPNVGKSSLFNRLVGKKTAIVHDTPGVTRDRNYGETEWNGKKFFLIDTGGYVPNSKDKFESAIREQVRISIDEADVILFVVDAKTGITPLDLEIAKLLRKEANTEDNIHKKVILAINKVDSRNDEGVEPDFFRLGLGEPLEVSALVGRRSGDLLDMITDNIPDDEAAGTDENGIKFAIIGRPNAGKSSLANALTQSNRNIVTDIPGTTRDPIDSLVTYYGQEITLIDTAGLRKKSRIKRAESLEYFSALRTHKSIERCDVAIIVIDATSFVSKLSKFTNAEEAVFKLGKEDVEIIIKAAELKKGILLVINKWDLVEKETNTAKIFENKVKEHLKTYDYLPFLFTSAITKQRVSKIIERALDVYNERAKEIKTSELNDKLLPYIKEFPPRSKSHKELKINYITQLQHSPPVIGFFCNLPSEIEVNYKRYLENKVRFEFGFTGVPITLAFKKKN
ncbi:MAG: ribosome biogenesis GTPase Der [Ignavibacteria bacterium]|nr:ribosome biogenesis GTPase Der [Ignavibacteria bacterium]